MPKTVALTKAQIADWPNLVWAAQRTCRGKSRSSAVQVLREDLDPALGRIRKALLAGSMPVGRFCAFTIHDPKQRLIHAAPLIDRIAHHAITRFIEPVLEQVLLPSVFACRKGKGVHAAVAYAQRQARRFPWVMHVDIRHYFPSIDHAVLRRQLCRRFRGDGLQLLDAVIVTHHTQTGVGLPIGALTSQHFANHYLATADRWCLAQPAVTAHCRYMDDFLLWSKSRADLRALREELADHLQSELKLTIKPPLIQRSAQGIPFCGIHIRPQRLRPNLRRRRRFRHGLRRVERRWQAGEIDSLQLQQAYAAVAAILLPADDPQWRAHCLAAGVSDA